MSGITFAADKVINKLIVNGEEVAFKQNPNNLYVYTSENPIIADSETPSKDPESGGKGDSSSSTSHGSSGGSGKSSGGISISKPVQTEKFPELKGHWGETEISALVDKGIVKGDGSSLELKQNITRAEFAALLSRALSLPNASYSEKFSDVSATDWFSADIMAVSNANLMQGYDGKANPNDSITREQMAKMVTEAYYYIHPDYEKAAVSSVWSDSADISDWAVQYVDAAYSAGLMNGVGDNAFSPKQAVAREQAFVAIYRLLNK